MSEILFYLACAACLLTLGVLMVGVGGFGTGKMSGRFQNKMMRYRIAAQFMALVIMMVLVVVAKNGG